MDDTLVIPNPVRTEFGAHGHWLRQIWREDDMAVYERSLTKDKAPHELELVVITVAKEKLMPNGSVVAAHEVYPRDSHWGRFGWRKPGVCMYDRQRGSFSRCSGAGWLSALRSRAQHDESLGPDRPGDPNLEHGSSCSPRHSFRDIPRGPTSELALACDLQEVIGVIERDGGTLYCTALFFGPEGLLGKHRKLMPTAVERIIWGFGDGSTLPVFDTPGAVICWENYMPLLRAAMYAKGIQIYCAPTADDRETWLPTIRHIALEGRCFVLSACQYIRRGDYPADYPAIQGDDPQTVLMRGCSVIVNPLGRVLAGPDYSNEKILTADLDLGEIAEGKFDLDVTGHYSRPDVFRLEVNEKASF